MTLGETDGAKTAIDSKHQNIPCCLLVNVAALSLAHRHFRFFAQVVQLQLITDKTKSCEVVVWLNLSKGKIANNDYSKRECFMVIYDETCGFVYMCRHKTGKHKVRPSLC